MRLVYFLPAIVAVWPAAGAEVSFEKDVKPIFQKNCFECHGATQQMANLRLDLKKVAMTAGRNKIAIVPGVSASSVVYLRLIGTSQGAQMPPAGPLSAEDIAAIKTWIDQGAEWPDDSKTDPGWKADPRIDPLLAEIRKGNFAPVQQAITSSSDLARARNASGRTLLMQTAIYGTAENMQWLLSHDADAGADVNVRSEDGRTPLYIALERTRIADVLKPLVEHGVNLTSERGQADPLSAVSRNCDMDSVKLLVVQKPYDGKYPPAALTAAAAGDCLAEMQLMIEKGMSKTALTDAFRSAALNSREETLSALLKAGADVNAKDAAGTTALMRAAHSDYTDAARIEWFLDHGADVTAHDRNGNTALKEAKRKGEGKAVELLIAAGEKE